MSVTGLVSRRTRAEYAAAAVLAVVGLLMAHHPMLLSGLTRIQSDPGDSRLIQYFLEHDYRWLRGDPNHAAIWSPPFFYPHQNSLALSDTLFAVAPLYATFRVAGFVTDTSFQLWMMAVSLLNYAVMFHLLRKRLNVSILSSSAGAFLFAFGAPRVNLIGHQQHLPQFLSLVTIDALFGVFPGRGVPAWKRAGLWFLAVFGLAAQLTTGFYLGWFLVLAIGTAAVVALLVPSTRPTFLAVLARDLTFIVGALALGGWVMRPWLAHHWTASRELGPRFIQYVYMYLPSPMTWLYQGPQSWLGGWTTRLTHFRAPITEAEQRLGVGPLTTLAIAAGLYFGRERSVVWLLSSVAAVIVLTITPLPAEPIFFVAHALAVAAIAFSFTDRHSRPGVYAAVCVLMILELQCFRRPRESIYGASTFAAASGAWAFLTREADSRQESVAGAAALGLALSLFALPVLGIGLAYSGLIALLGFVFGWRSRLWVEGALIGGTLLFGLVFTYLERPGAWLAFASGAVSLLLLADRRPLFRPPGGSLVILAVTGLTISNVFADDGTAWNFFATRVPGASALMFVSRGGLTLLPLYSIGLALFLDWLREGGHGRLALAVGAVFMAEQGVTTDSFDKAKNRREIASLAARIDEGAEAFYYTPLDSTWASPKSNLDAMWAGLERGKPTVNGYSGSTPVGWRALEDPNAKVPDDIDYLVVVLDEWRKTTDRSIHRLQWIVGTDGPSISPGSIAGKAEPSP